MNEPFKPLNILHLTNHLNIGGVTSYIYLLSNEMAKRGHKVFVGSAGGAMEADFQKRGIEPWILPMETKNILSPKIGRSARRVEKFVRQEKIDIIHAHTHVSQSLADKISKKTGVRFVSTCHGYFKRNLGRKLFPLWGERVIAISGAVAEDLEKTHRVDKDRISVVKNAINIEDSENRLAEKDPREIRFWYRIPEDAKVVVSIARLSKDKGHEFFIEAATEILKKRKDIYFVIFGDGKLRDELKTSVVGRDIESHFFIITAVKDPTIGYAIADVFVHTAPHREGFGLAIAEAMALGKPVIMTDIPAINTLYTDKKHALFVKPSDSQDLAEKIVTLVDDPVRRDQLALAGKEYARSFCGISRMGDEMEAFYRKTLTENKILGK